MSAAEEPVEAAPAAPNAAGGGDLSSAQLKETMKIILKDQDLTTMGVRSLRHRVAQHSGLPTKGLDGRMGEFRDLAGEVVEEMRQAAPPSAPAPPEWMDLEDDEKSCFVYLVTFAAILADSVFVGCEQL